MINIANRHPKLHLFQVVTDFMKTDVGMLQVCISFITEVMGILESKVVM